GADEPAIEIEPGFLRIDVGLDPCELRRAVASSCGIAVVRIAVVGVTVVGITPAPTPSPSARHNHGAVTSVPAAVPAVRLCGNSRQHQSRREKDREKDLIALHCKNLH